MAMLELNPDAVGRPFREVFFPDVTQAVDGLMKEIQQTGFAMERMVTARLAQGLELHIAISSSILRDDSFAPGAMANLLEGPIYTKPPAWRGREIPDVLLSGHHAEIHTWRRARSVERGGA